MAKVALILHGCGVYDGAECTESVSAIVALSRLGASVEMFAPNKPQMHVVNHLTGTPAEGEVRNVLEESARIARGKVKDLSEIDVDGFDAIFFPGGFGVAKNLSNFATAGAELEVDTQIEQLIGSFLSKKKVLAFSCIAPILAAKVIKNVTLTFGMDEGDKFPYAGTVGAAKTLGATHVNIPAPCMGTVVDEENLVVTGPAYMYDGEPHEIYDSIGAIVEKMVDMVEKNN
mmetsp:Transcript_29499/g.67853  ORF Transcript_29499/g.67853 Transcript_29499/m.67853 type:complete len:230 (-) Transcript_29499:290-979(-)|eukprot:CAMPEP_0113297536 /NCGR_PEP_ID=MMETSP0010_2-20120614/354_1 /TAXON_ID=216773 ORGANISM="Corethron hystrix, Strain 308" /NCGR_SAMPLE_ID=MMETSP0010_2 /ASSEMBLY_ACC=CAM_ASM_000155 /LENGTH=229 /DNA_ID=CAMNT_0000150435 /DNA_START=54 /DNA_END=743 /DNA_ORIENTATION=- /assembly_acc=CAM_ASM_000155